MLLASLLLLMTIQPVLFLHYKAENTASTGALTNPLISSAPLLRSVTTTSQHAVNLNDTEPFIPENFNPSGVFVDSFTDFLKSYSEQPILTAKGGNKTVSSIVLVGTPPLFSVRSPTVGGGDEIARQAIQDKNGALENTSPLDLELLSICDVTASVQVEAYHRNDTTNASDGDSSTIWVLRTFNSKGAAKTMGGDDYYVEYSDRSEQKGDDIFPNKRTGAAAIATDLQDGTYLLNFSSVPFQQQESKAEGGTISIYLHFSCGMGSVRPRRKQRWSQCGAINSRFDVEVPLTPPIKVSTPSLTVTTKTKQRMSDTVDLSVYDMVLCIGDSTMEQFLGSYIPVEKRKAFNLTSVGDKKKFFRNNTYMSKDINSALYNIVSLERFQNFAREGLNLPWVRDAPRKAIVVGTFLWDLLELNDVFQFNADFAHSIKHLKMYMVWLNETYGNATIDIFFKSGTAVQVHEVSRRSNGLKWASMYRIYYMSHFRAHKLHTMQMDLMKELDIPVLNIYWPTYHRANWLYEGDASHYQPEFNQWLLDWFYGGGQSDKGSYL